MEGFGRHRPVPLVKHAPIIYARNAARLVRQERLDGGPFIVGEFVAHDSRLQFGSLNHAPGGIINPLRPVMTDANTLNSLPLSGAQPTWWDVLLAAPQSKMTQLADNSQLFFPALTARPQPP